MKHHFVQIISESGSTIYQGIVSQDCVDKLLDVVQKYSERQAIVRRQKREHMVKRRRQQWAKVQEENKRGEEL